MAKKDASPLPSGKIFVDPPSGWQYGFPKEAPDMNCLLVSGVTMEEWFLANGYPQKLIDQGMLQYCRYIYEEDSEN